MAGLMSTSIAATTAAVANRFVASTNMSLTTYTIANASPVWAGGCLVTVTHTTVAGADTLGTITIVGTDLLGQTQTESITPVAGTIATGRKIFRTVVSATSVGWVATSTADTIVIGCAADSYAAQGGGYIDTLVVLNVVATAFSIGDASGTLVTYPASLPVGSYKLGFPWSGFLRLATTSTNSIEVLHTSSIPTTYAMS